MKHHPVSAAQALDLLKQGNDRFVANVRSIDSSPSKHRREALIEGQEPFAIMLSCSDSRVPSELVFDCGLGDLFVVRVAGNIVAPSIVGSVEFAAATFGTPLVVVMGHTRCGAIQAAVDKLRSGKNELSENVRDIVDRISPGLVGVVKSAHPPDDVMAEAVKANVRVSANHLRHGSRMLEELISGGHLRVANAMYSIETGRVEFFD